ncbi:molybdopterin oxidoreductase [Cellulomonas marina]|nr:molybdopterin oxidoreductase [Cellulomonas marina]
MVLHAGDRPAELQPDETFPVNRGGLCSKGWTAAELLDHPERLLAPLVRAVPGDRSSRLVPTTWEDAYDRIAAAVRTTQAVHGPDAVGVFGGGGLTNEKAYALGKFARVALGTSAIDYNGRFCMSSAATAANRAFGIDRGLPFPLEDVAAADVLLVVGSNAAATMPPAMQWVDAGRERGALHVVVDPRRTATAKGASLHLQPVPGTDLALALGLLHVVVKDRLVDEEYVAARTSGFEAVRASVASFWPDRVERITGVAVADLRRVAHALAEAPAAMVLTARGAEQHAAGTDTATAFIHLALALGLPGRPGSGYGTLTGQGNGQGGREHGQKADQLPGYRRLDDPTARAHVAGVWGVDPDSLPGPGRSAYEMLDRLGRDDGVRGLLVMASNIAVSAPRGTHVVERLKALDFLAVSDLFLSETAALADVVLPTAQWAEEEGTMTNLEGRVIHRRKAIDPPAGVRDDLATMHELATRLGQGDKFPTDPRTVFDELRQASAGGTADYAGITYERLDAEDGVFWPCPSEDHPGTPRLFAERFATPDGRARCVPVTWQERVEPTGGAYPYVLTTGRLMEQYQSGAQTRRVRQLSLAQPEPRAELHPDLARRHGVGDDDHVRLTTRRGSAVFRVRLTDEIRPDTVFVPFHWGGGGPGAGHANALTDDRLDPLSRMPAFKACAVAVARADEPVPPPPATTLVAPTSALASIRTSATSARRPDRGTAVPSTPRFLQTIAPFTGKGLDQPVPFSPALVYEVPDGAVAQTVYFRGGNSSDELACVVLLRDGEPMRYFPVGAKADTHVPLRVVENLEAGTVVELQVSAPDGASGVLVVDLGLVEV